MMVPRILRKLILLSAILVLGCGTSARRSEPAEPPPSQVDAQNNPEPAKSAEAQPEGDEQKNAEPPPPPVRAGDLDPLYKRFNDARMTKQFKLADEIAGQILAHN